MGKGGSQTSKVEIPKWLEDYAKSMLAQASETAKIGYTPYYGPDVAAMTPGQLSAIGNTNAAASAFGMQTYDPTAGMPQSQDYNGMQAYSSGPIYDMALAELQRRRPAQYAALTAPFIDPVTGAATRGVYGASTGTTGTTGGTGTGTTREGGGNMAYGGAGGMPGAGGLNSYGGTRSMDTIGSYMPGGVNTNNPNSLGNRLAAALTGGVQGLPTAADRPISRSSGVSGWGGGGGWGGGSSSGGSYGGNGGRGGITGPR